MFQISVVYAPWSVRNMFLVACTALKHTHYVPVCVYCLDVYALCFWRRAPTSSMVRTIGRFSLSFSLQSKKASFDFHLHYSLWSISTQPASFLIALVGLLISFIGKRTLNMSCHFNFRISYIVAKVTESLNSHFCESFLPLLCKFFLKYMFMICHGILWWAQQF